MLSSAPSRRCSRRGADGVGDPGRRRSPAGAADRIGDTRTPQAVFAVVRRPRVGIDALDGATLVRRGHALSDPGNVGTLMRSAAAAGATALGLGPDRSTRTIPRSYAPPPARVSRSGPWRAYPQWRCSKRSARTASAASARSATGGAAPEAIDLRVPTAFVLGNEAHGLDADLPLDELVTIPMQAGESLNVAMAGTVLLLEAARQRRTAS